MQQLPVDSGWIEVIAGSMFSGKTEELIRRITRARIAKQKAHIFKPLIDTRYDSQRVVSHNGQSIPSTVINEGSDIYDHLDDDVMVVGIDEVQFLDEGTVRVARDLAKEGRRVIVAGLDQDFRSEPFVTMMRMMVEAEYVTKVLAICVQCGNPAHRNQRISDATGRVVLGGADSYEARCRKCFDPARVTEQPLFF